MLRAALLGLLTAGCIGHWQPRDEVLAVGASAAIAADCISTAAMLNLPDVVERNPLLGPQPSTSTVVGMCLLGTGVTLGIASALPEKNGWRRGWLLFLTAVEMTFVANNLSLLFGAK